MQIDKDRTFFSVALPYVEKLGWSVIPIWPMKDGKCTCGNAGCENHGKHPAIRWKEYQTKLPTRNDLKFWNAGNPARQWGLACGVASGIIVVDCDDAEAEAWADARLPKTPLIVKSSKGSHRYYRRGSQLAGSITSWAGHAGHKIDLRGDNGYIVLPPSMHKSGRQYAWHSKPERLGDIPVYDPTWFPRPEPKPALPLTTMQLDAIRGLTRSDATNQARRFLLGCPGAVADQGGNTRSFRVACALARGFGLGDEEALSLFLEWNQTCSPPWSFQECEMFLRNARVYGKGTIGSLLRKKTFKR